ncbi:AMP-binding protein [Metabacillus herbersteinensis]|uniref:AMP-binding protein n=1 Tax=Metabacillus herbersteinensis TaxID=283816 RepID=A0ABV6GIZ4_9BACI
MLITDNFSTILQNNPTKIAIQNDQKKITYNELNTRINQIANGLLSLGVIKPVKGTPKVALLLDNGIEFLETFLAVAKIGWIAVPFDTKWNSNEIETITHKCSPDFLITEEKYQKNLKQAGSSCLVLSFKSKNNLLKMKSLEQWIDLQSEIPPKLEITKDSLFYMGFTSGTTGNPKAFVRSHHSWVESFKGGNIEFECSSNDRVLVLGPLVHSLFLYAAIHTLFIGGHVTLLTKFSPTKTLEILEHESISVIYFVPTMFEAIHQSSKKNPNIAEYSLQTVISSGAKWSPKSKQHLKEIFPNVNMYEFYGASELSFVTILDPKGNEERPDSVGRPFHNVKIELRDPNNQVVKDGEVGKLYVQSEYIFSGYYQNEAETALVIKDGWATVGDMAVVDKDGYITIVGREKNMIIYGGLNIYPEEVEKILLHLPEIDEVIVIGVSDSYWGEKITCVVKFKENQLLSDRELKAYCRKHLAAYKCPRDIVTVDFFPYTSSGKIARKRLKDWLENGMNDYYE